MRLRAAIPPDAAACGRGDIDVEGPAPPLPWRGFRELHDYWRSRCVGDRLPGRAAIDPLGFPKLLPGVFLVDVLRGAAADPPDFRFRLVGTAHVAMNEVDITGMTIEEAFSAGGPATRVRAAYTRVVLTRRAMVTFGLRAAVPGRSHITFDRMLLPLAADGFAVDMLLGHVHQRDGTG